MDLQLKGHRAIVTGSSAGIGEAIARKLAAEGAAVIVHGRQAHAVNAVAQAISADGGQAEGLTADLADPGDCAWLVSRALAGGDIDILVNNAGAFANRGWDDTAPEDWLALYATNVAAAVRCIQGFLPAMRASGWGRIVQIGTGEAVNPFPTMPDYAASKAALLNLTASLAGQRGGPWYHDLRDRLGLGGTGRRKRQAVRAVRRGRRYPHRHGQQVHQRHRRVDPRRPASDRPRSLRRRHKYSLNVRDGDLNAGGNHRKNLVQALEASLQRLRADHVDILWLHAWDYLTPPEEVMRALDDQVRLGKVLYLGISDTPAWVVAQMQTLAADRGWSTFAGLQVEYSLVQREVERELIPMARGLGLGVLAWGPLGAGVLSGKYANPDTPAAGRRLADVDPGRLAIARAVADVADGLGLSSSVVALAWLRAQGNVIPILGARTAQQLADNLTCLDVNLPPDALARLDQASHITRGFPHDFLASADFILGGMSGQLDLPPGRSAHG